MCACLCITLVQKLLRAQPYRFVDIISPPPQRHDCTQSIIIIYRVLSYVYIRIFFGLVACMCVCVFVCTLYIGTRKHVFIEMYEYNFIRLTVCVCVCTYASTPRVRIILRVRFFVPIGKQSRK